MPYTRYKTVNFGTARAGLATVGYTLTGGSRITAGVAEVGTSTGVYGATVSFPDAFAGAILWDTGGTGDGLLYAAEEVNPVVDANVVQVDGSPVAVGTLSPAEIRAEMDAGSTKLAAILVDTAELQTDWANGGRLDLLLDAAAAGGAGGTVTLDLDQVGFSPRALDDVEDGEITLGDCLIAGLVGAVGDFARSGVTLVKKTPATNTTVRTLVFDSIASPTTRS